MNTFIKYCWNTFLVLAALFVTVMVAAGAHALVTTAVAGGFIEELVIGIVVVILFAKMYPNIHAYLEDYNKLNQRNEPQKTFRNSLEFDMENGTVFVWTSPNDILYFVQIKRKMPYSELTLGVRVEIQCIESKSVHTVWLNELRELSDYHAEVCYER